MLRVEKRLDDKLFYLRDALPEYSTFSFDMDPEILPEGTPVPINPVKVILYSKSYCGIKYIFNVYVLRFNVFVHLFTHYII